MRLTGLPRLRVSVVFTEGKYLILPPTAAAFPDATDDIRPLTLISRDKMTILGRSPKYLLFRTTPRFHGALSEHMQCGTRILDPIPAA